MVQIISNKFGGPLPQFSFSIALGRDLYAYMDPESSGVGTLLTHTQTEQRLLMPRVTKPGLGDTEPWLGWPIISDKDLSTISLLEFITLKQPGATPSFENIELCSEDKLMLSIKSLVNDLKSMHRCLKGIQSTMKNIDFQAECMLKKGLFQVGLWRLRYTVEVILVQLCSRFQNETLKTMINSLNICIKELLKGNSMDINIVIENFPSLESLSELSELLRKLSVIDIMMVLNSAFTDNLTKKLKVIDFTVLKSQKSPESMSKIDATTTWKDRSDKSLILFARALLTESFNRKYPHFAFYNLNTKTKIEVPFINEIDHLSDIEVFRRQGKIFLLDSAGIAVDGVRINSVKGKYFQEGGLHFRSSMVYFALEETYSEGYLCPISQENKVRTKQKMNYYELDFLKVSQSIPDKWIRLILAEEISPFTKILTTYSSTHLFKVQYSVEVSTNRCFILNIRDLKLESSIIEDKLTLNLNDVIRKLFDLQTRDLNRCKIEQMQIYSEDRLIIVLKEEDKMYENQPFYIFCIHFNSKTEPTLTSHYTIPRSRNTNQRTAVLFTSTAPSRHGPARQKLPRLLLITQRSVKVLTLWHNKFILVSACLINSELRDYYVPVDDYTLCTITSKGRVMVFGGKDGQKGGAGIGEIGSGNEVWMKVLKVKLK